MTTKIIIVDMNGILEKLTDLIYLSVENFNIYTETTGSYNSWMNAREKFHHISIHKIVRSDMIDLNESE